MKIAELANCQNDTEGILADINVSLMIVVPRSCAFSVPGVSLGVLLSAVSCSRAGRSEFVLAFGMSALWCPRAGAFFR